MTIALRLYASILAVVAGLVSLAGLGIYQMAKVYDGADHANINTVSSLLDLDDAFVSISQLRIQIWQYIALKDPAMKAALETGMSAAHAKVMGRGFAVVARVKCATDIIGEITTAGREQSCGIEQINQAISHTVTQQNTALVEEATTAASGHAAVRLRVTDNGEGIAPENLLGTLTAHSEGAGSGAPFTLLLPIHTVQAVEAA